MVNKNTLLLTFLKDGYNFRMISTGRLMYKHIIERLEIFGTEVDEATDFNNWEAIMNVVSKIEIIENEAFHFNINRDSASVNFSYSTAPSANNRLKMRLSDKIDEPIVTGYSTQKLDRFEMIYNACVKFVDWYYNIYLPFKKHGKITWFTT